MRAGDFIYIIVLGETIKRSIFSVESLESIDEIAKDIKEGLEGIGEVVLPSVTLFETNGDDDRSYSSNNSKIMIKYDVMFIVDKDRDLCNCFNIVCILSFLL